MRERAIFGRRLAASASVQCLLGHSATCGSFLTCVADVLSIIVGRALRVDRMHGRMAADVGDLAFHTADAGPRKAVYKHVSG